MERVVEPQERLFHLAARAVAATLEEAIERCGSARWVLAGGTTPLALYERLVERHRDALDWSRVEFYWGDERAVPPDHPSSNYGASRTALLAPLGIAAGRVHRIRGERESGEAAGEYAATVAAALAAAPWDLVLLGLGADGHTASLFPLLEPAAGGSWAIATTAPEEPRRRVSLTLRALNRSRAVFFLVTGSSKADAVRRVEAGDLALPPTRVRPPGGYVRWYVDPAAAGSAAARVESGTVGSE